VARGLRSTNDLAAERAKADAPEGLVIATDQQSAGRGRLGRAWHSPPGESLYLSILLRPARPAPEIPPLTLLAGAAVARALASLGFGRGSSGRTTFSSTPQAVCARWRASSPRWRARARA
jgi:BirA family biotin operon repressor/biotin-[acetyl-CoA-carboxylase] ligase